MLTSRGLPSDSTCVLKAEPGKLDIKRREPGIQFISFPIVSLFKLAIMTSFSIFVLIQRHLSDVIQKVQRHHDLIKATCREIDNVYQATRSNAVGMSGN